MAKKSKAQTESTPIAQPQEGVVVGIDLGTTNSAVAIFNADGKPEIINNLDGQRTTPSAVNMQDENNPVVGQAALNMLAMAAAYIVRWIKRLMGRVDSNNNPLPGFIHPDSSRSDSSSTPISQIATIQGKHNSSTRVICSRQEGDDGSVTALSVSVCGPGPI